MIIKMIFELMSDIIGFVIDAVMGPLVMPVFIVNTFDWLRELMCSAAGPLVYLITPEVWRMYCVIVVELMGVRLGILTYKTVRNMTI